MIPLTFLLLGSLYQGLRDGGWVFQLSQVVIGSPPNLYAIKLPLERGSHNPQELGTCDHHGY